MSSLGSAAGKPVVVVGGGIAGIQAALDLAEMGVRVHLVEKGPSVGGVMSQLDKTFPTNDCSMCILAPKMIEVYRHPGVTIHTLSEVTGVSGSAGDFRVTVTEQPRSVNAEKCTGCGVCSEKCPVKAPSEYQAGTGPRKAIYLAFPQAVPLTAAIDRGRCLYFTKGVCKVCQRFCPAGAIDYGQEPRETVIEAASIVLAPGYGVFDASRLSEYGYGRLRNVVTSMEFERIMSATGPYRGVISRPSDASHPKKIAFLQCVGSRDTRVGNPYCSGVCCMYAIKEAVIAMEHSPGLEVTVFFMDIRAFGKEFDDYYTRAEREHGVRFIRSRVASADEDPETRGLTVSYEQDGEIRREAFDMLVLSVGLEAPGDAKALAGRIGFKLNEHGFMEVNPFAPVESSVPGVYAAGAFTGPKDIPDSVAQASGAAAKAARHAGKAEGVRVEQGEIDVSGQEPRVGVFVCHCGTNIGGVVRVPEVAAYAKTLPGVAYVEENLFTCSQDSQKRMKQLIAEKGLNRVVVASCTPRTHEPLFRATLAEAGLNPYLFEMANIRDQCSWVHMHEPEEATRKAKDLVHMAVAKARLLQPLRKPVSKVTASALVIGAGPAGMAAALEIADQGYPVDLVEREAELGGNLRRIRHLPGADPQTELGKLIDRIRNHPRIRVHLSSRVTDAHGYVGNFESVIAGADGEETVKHGVTVIATGGAEYKPKEYGYGSDPRIMTQLELEESLHAGYKPGAVAMIQCVGSRCPERTYCSRVCCTGAVYNALKVKEANPAAEVYVLYKDMRTYGFREDIYREAADRGVVFVRYDDEHKPAVTTGGTLTVRVTDPVLREPVVIEPDAVVLSAAIIPNEGARDLAALYKVPLSKDGFFLEAHMKLRPLDFATDGVYLCGLAHAPKGVEEAMSQAAGAAARALTVLSKPYLEAEGAIATVDVDTCCGCRLCEHVCEYNAVQIVEEDGRKHSKVTAEACKGCGVCAATCPSGAITVGHFTDEEILSQVKAAAVEARP